MPRRAHQNHPKIADDTCTTPQLTNNTLAITPTSPVDNTMTDVLDQSVNDPGCMAKEIGNTNTHISDLEKEFKIFRSEFSNFCLENATNDIQADLDNVQCAQYLINKTLTSKMDTFDNEIMSRVDNMNKELSSQMSELMKLIQSNVIKPSLVPGQAESDQAITEELLFNHKMERMHQSCMDPHPIVTDKEKAPERAHSPQHTPLPPSPQFQPIVSMSRVDPININP